MSQHRVRYFEYINITSIFYAMFDCAAVDSWRKHMKATICDQRFILSLTAIEWSQTGWARSQRLPP
jgi:hypothetical protein